MKTLIISSKGRGLGVAYRLQEEGHDVLFKDSDPYSTIGHDVVPCTNAPLSQLLRQKLDLVLLFGYQLGNTGARLIREGYPVIGATPFSDALETDPRFCQAIGPFLNPDPARAGFLQAGWFDGQKFLPQFYTGYNHTRLFPGDIGPAVPSSGAILRPTQGRPSGLTQAIEWPLRSSKYIGPVIVHDDSVSCYFFPGVSEAMMTLIRQPLGEFFLKLSEQKAYNKKNHDWAVAAQVSVPPYPMEKLANRVQGQGLCGSSWETDLGRHYIWMEDVMRIGEMLCCAGKTGSLGYVTAHGRTLKETRRRVVRCIERMSVEDLQYRKDVGMGWSGNQG